MTSRRATELGGFWPIKDLVAKLDQSDMIAIAAYLAPVKP